MNPLHQQTNSAGTLAVPPAFSTLQPDQPSQDAWLESLLREDAAATVYLDDVGFSERVITQLPQQALYGQQAAFSFRHFVSRWIVPLMALLGLSLGLGFFSGGENLLTDLMTLSNIKSASLNVALMAIAPIGLLYWLGVGAALRER